MKKLLLALFTSVCLAACNDTGGEPLDIKYVNQSGMDVYIKGWSWHRDTLIRYESDLRCIKNGKTYVFHTCTDCYGERENGYLYSDTVLIRFSSERELIYGYNDAGTPTKMENYEFIPKSSFKSVDTYVFTFTPEMYEAATPIVPPAEE